MRYGGPGFEVRSTESDRIAAGSTCGAFFRAKCRVEALVGRAVPSGVLIEIHPNAASLRDRAVALSCRPPPEWVAGLAFPSKNLILLRKDLAEVRREGYTSLLAHELTHIALGGLRDATGRSPLPLWFEEGLAQAAELWSDPTDQELLWRAWIFGRLPDLAAISEGFPAGSGEARVAYAAGRAMVRSLRTGAGEGREFKDLIAAVAAGRPFAEALGDWHGESLDAAEARWRKDVRGDPAAWIAFGLQVLLVLAVLVFLIAGHRRISDRRAAAMNSLSEEDEDSSLAEADWEAGLLRECEEIPVERERAIVVRARKASRAGQSL